MNLPPPKKLQPDCAPKDGRILMVDTLRGMLAWLVVLYHCIGMAGYHASQYPILSVFNANDAVCCFFIVSGFSIVCSLLGSSAETSLKSFFVRRWFRIYPIYILALALTFAATTAMAWSMPHPPEGTWLGVILNYQRPDHAALQHWGLHLFMLQGTLPDWILAGNRDAILCPAWSLSIEEQFYLLAPIPILLFVKKKRLWHLISIFAVFGTLWAIRRIPNFNPDWYVKNGFIIQFYDYFLLGICSAFVIHKNTPTPWRWAYAGGMLLALGLNWRLHRGPEPAVVLWCFVFALVFISRTKWKHWIHWPVRILENRAFVWLGKCSYSTYLFHWMFMALSVFLLEKWVPGQGTSPGRFVYILAFTGLATLGFSSALQIFVESPLIAMGRKIAKKFRQPGVPPTSQP